MARPYDAIVIGSGFGGAIVARRLAERGMSVLVLERGRRWTVETYPRRATDPWFYSAAAPHRRNGWIDVRPFDRMTVALGAGVGGGSLCYSAVAVEAPPQVFETGWPAEIAHADLQPYYLRVAQEMNLQRLPDNQLSRRFALARDGARNIGHAARFGKTGLAMNFSEDWSEALDGAVDARHSRHFVNAHGVKQGTCVHLGNCDIGCDVGAKNSLDFNYVPRAEKAGAEFRPLHVVRALEPLARGGYRVRFDDLRDGAPRPGVAEARRVILSAGSLGSTELLLRCRDDFRTLPQISHRLGKGWSGNANVLTFAKYPAAADLRQSTGPTIAGMIDFTDGAYRGQRFAVEDDGFPNLLLAIVRGRAGAGWPPGARPRLERFERWMRERSLISSVMVWLGSGADAGDGTLSLARRGWRRRLALDLDYPLASNAPVHDAARAMHGELTRATGGRLMPNPFRRLISLHPLGGCGMGDTPAAGVVDHRGAVHRCPGLYVIDGATIPVPTVLNPSHTIAALAERAAELID